jgi:hypothetical protein
MAGGPLGPPARMRPWAEGSWPSDHRDRSEGMYARLRSKARPPLASRRAVCLAVMPATCRPSRCSRCKAASGRFSLATATGRSRLLLRAITNAPFELLGAGRWPCLRRWARRSLPGLRESAARSRSARAAASNSATRMLLAVIPTGALRSGGNGGKPGSLTARPGAVSASRGELRSRHSASATSLTAAWRHERHCRCQASAAVGG